MRGRHVGWTTPQGQKDGEGKRICTFDLMHVTHPLWLAELWGRGSELLVGLFHQLTPSAFQICINNERAEPLELLRVQGFEMVRASGNAPDPGTHLVRLRL